MKKTKSRSEADQFYIKFKYNDVLSSTSLRECNAVGAGVYLYILCLLCKPSPRGKYRLNNKYVSDLLHILPQQNVQQTNRQMVRHLPEICCALAAHFVKHLPFSEAVIAEGLDELLRNDVIYLEGTSVCQKRMVKDAEISAKRSISGGKGAEKTNKKNKKEGDETAESFAAPFAAANRNYNYNYNSNYNLEENKGDIEITEGGMGDSNSGGKGEDAENDEIDHYLGNWHLKTSPENCKRYYFHLPTFQKPREETLKILYNYYKPEDQTLLVERLEVWADEFNTYLARTTPEKTMTGPDGWPNHFHNWLNSQKQRLKVMPDKRIDKTEKTKGILPTNASIEDQEKYYARKHTNHHP